MNDFTKQKVAFAVGLLAVLFTVTPLLQAFGAVGYRLLGVDLTVLRLYYFLSVVLMLAVYSYSIQFITERDLRYPAVTGNLLYAVAIVTPVLYIVLFGIVELADRAGRLLEFTIVRWLISNVLSLLAGIAAARTTYLIQRIIGRKEKGAAAAQLEREEMQFLRRAEQLDAAGHHDLAVVEAWKAIEVAARRSLLQRDITLSPRGNVVRDIEHHRLLPQELLAELNHVRQFRNLAARAVEPISKEQSQTAISATARVLAALAPQEGEPGDSSRAA